MEDLFAMLYVDTSLDHRSLLESVARFLDGEVADWTVESQAIEADVRPNDDYRSPERASSLNDFVYFPYTVDVESVGSTGLEAFLGAISKIMFGLAGSRMRVVVACEWEDRLPGGGRLVFSSGR
jgi:hypothetical protein